jgi:uncharacterized membrane protein YqhA
MTGRKSVGFLDRLLSKSPYLILIAVIGSFLASVTALVLSGLEVINIILSLVNGGYPYQQDDTARLLYVDVIELIDSLLLGTVLYIIALGLYQLFINSDFEMPKWLHIDTLDDLKERLLTLIAVMLVVIFLRNVVTWDHSMSILWLGMGIALVSGVIAYFLGVVWTARMQVHRMEIENSRVIANSKQENWEPLTPSNRQGAKDLSGTERKSALSTDNDDFGRRPKG